MQYEYYVLNFYKSKGLRYPTHSLSNEIKKHYSQLIQHVPILRQAGLKILKIKKTCEIYRTLCSYRNSKSFWRTITHNMYGTRDS